MNESTAYVTDKLSKGELSKEDAKVLNLESARLKKEKEIKESLQKVSTIVGANFSAGMLIDVPEGSETLLPQGYVMSSNGVFQHEFTEEEDVDLDSWIRLCRTPFFIASRTKSHIQLLYRSQKEWLRGWLRPSEIKPSTLSNLFILPEKNIKQKQLVEYANACIIYAPIISGDDYIESMVREIFTQISPSEYPALIRVSDVSRICSDVGVKYDEVRKWLEARGYIKHGPGTVKRAPDPLNPQYTKAQRFLVMLKPLE